MATTVKALGPRGISDETVLDKTGKRWDEWYAILDEWDDPAKGHTKMARFLEQEHAVSGWWAQSITVRYAWERGLRREAVVPDDLREALASNGHASERFEQLSATHKREYVAWIEEARRPETRARRITGTIERLSNEPAESRSTGPR